MAPEPTPAPRPVLRAPALGETAVASPVVPFVVEDEKAVSTPVPEVRGGLWRGISQGVLLDGLATAKASRFRAVGSTSTVFNMSLNAPFAGAFKAQTKARERGPAAEIAAYRTARCLGLDQVPPAVSRTFSVAKLRSGFVRNKRADFSTVRSRMVVNRAGKVWGAAIYWIPELRNLGVDEPASIRRYRRLLSQPPPASQDPLAADISTMALFDYLIGNYDRYSGSNAKGNADGTRLYFRDHDVAFPVELPERLRARMWERVADVEVFSSKAVAALRRFDSGCLFAELAQDARFEMGEPIEPSAYDGVFVRQRQILEHVDRLIVRYGSKAVLAFD